MKTKSFFQLCSLLLLAAQMGCETESLPARSDSRYWWKTQQAEAERKSRLAETAAQPVSPARLIENASQTLADQLVSNLPANKKLRIGIVPFGDKTGQAGTLAQALQESLRNRLFLSKRFDVVEDTDMQKVLRELKIQEQGQGVLSQDTIQRMGELLAAEAVVVGTITDLISDFGVNCRLVPVRSGVIASVAMATMPKAVLSDGNAKPYWLRDLK